MVKILVILFFFTHLYPESAKEEYEKGSLLFSQGKYAEAILEFNSCLKKNPYYKEAYHKLGLAYTKKKEYKNAIDAFNKAIALDKGYTEAINHLALAYEAYGKIDEAIKRIKEAIRQEPTNPEFHYNLAGFLHKKGLIFDSEKEYKRLIELEPSFYLAYLRLGDIYWKDKKKKNEAIFYYEEAKAKNPSSSLPHLSLGRLYFQSKELDKAIWEYKKAISKNKNPQDELRELGRIYIEKGNYKEAEKIYKRLSSLNDKLGKYCLGFIYEKQKMYPQALSCYEEALSILKEDEISQFSKEGIILSLSKEPVYSEKRKGSSLLHLKLAEDYLKQGMTSLAIYEYKRAISLNPEEVKIRLSLARIYENNGMFQEALEEIEKVLELEPQKKEAQDAIERISFKRKKTLLYQEGIDEPPKPDLRLYFFIIPKEPLLNPNSVNYLNHLLQNLLSFSKKLSLLKSPSKCPGNKEASIELAKQEGADFLLFAEVEEENEKLKIEAKLVNLEDLKEEEIFSYGFSYKEAIYYLSQKAERLLPIRGRIFKIEGNNCMINIGMLSGVKEQDILEVSEAGKTIAKIRVIKVDAEISKAIVLPPQTINILKINQEVKR